MFRIYQTEHACVQTAPNKNFCMQIFLRKLILGFSCFQKLFRPNFRAYMSRLLGICQTFWPTKIFVRFWCVQNCFRAQKMLLFFGGIHCYSEYHLLSVSHHHVIIPIFHVQFSCQCHGTESISSNYHIACWRNLVSFYFKTLGWLSVISIT